MIYAKYYSRVDETGAISAGIEWSDTQVDATWLQFNVPSVTWLYLDG